MALAAAALTQAVHRSALNITAVIPFAEVSSTFTRHPLHPGPVNQQAQRCPYEHPNTIAVYDYGRTPDGILYYAMEYLDGLNFDDLVKRFGPLSEARTHFVLKQVCGSLAEAHAHGLIHRDVKPANIFLTSRGGVFLLFAEELRIQP